jgi:hypothetical protein
LKTILCTAALPLICVYLISPFAAADSSAPQAGVILTDTGITQNQCYQKDSLVFVNCQSAGAIALSDSQDGMIGMDADSSNNTEADGKLGFSYQQVDGGCILDKTTKLTWELTASAGGLRDKTRAFTNLNKQQTGDVSELIMEANHQGWCGYHDWRLPNIDELQSLMDYGIAPPGPMLNMAWFPDTQSRAYWSATPVVAIKPENNTLGHVWVLYFGDGEMAAYGRYLSLPARLVRGEQTQADERYLISADGEEVTDTVANLIWRRCLEGAQWRENDCIQTPYHPYTQEAAFALAKEKATRSKKSWRLPNVKELSSIMQRNHHPAFDLKLFPETPTNDWIWTSTPAIGRPAAEDRFHNEVREAWYGSFENGAMVRYDRYNTHSVRLVRTRESSAAKPKE